MRFLDHLWQFSQAIAPPGFRSHESFQWWLTAVCFLDWKCGNPKPPPPTRKTTGTTTRTTRATARTTTTATATTTTTTTTTTSSSSSSSSSSSLQSILQTAVLACLAGVGSLGIPPRTIQEPPAVTSHTKRAWWSMLYWCGRFRNIRAIYANSVRAELLWGANTLGYSTLGTSHPLPSPASLARRRTSSPPMAPPDAS